jgi:hypothetical protein
VGGREQELELEQDQSPSEALDASEIQLISTEKLNTNCSTQLLASKIRRMGVSPHQVKVAIPIVSLCCLVAPSCHKEMAIVYNCDPDITLSAFRLVHRHL